MTESSLSSILIVESDDKVYFVEDTAKTPKIHENKKGSKKSKTVNKNKRFKICENEEVSINSPVK